MTTYNLSTLLEDSAASFPDRTALVFGETRLTYTEVNAFSNMVANLLVARGIQPGDKVALTCPNLPYFTIVYFGILKAGATVVPLNVLLKGREVAYHLDDSDAKAYFCFQGTPELPMAEAGYEGFEATAACEHFFVITADLAAPSPIDGTETMAQAMAGLPATFDTVATDEDDTAVILYTSGTTGQPKGAELRHRNMRDNARMGEALFGADAERPDTYLCVLPLFHSFGQTVIQNGGFAYGGTVVLLPRFEAHAALGLMQQEQVTFFAGVPTMYWGLLGALDDSVDVAALAANLRVAAAGGSALPVEVHKDFEKRFGVTILEGYGLSETSPVASFSKYGEPVRVGSIGTPIPGVEMKLIDPELERGQRRQRRPERDRRDRDQGPQHHEGLLRPARGDRRGDPRRLVPLRRPRPPRRDGWYYIVDRSKDMIIRGGYNVYPREIEEVLMTHPAVSLAAVIGVPNESHGEEIKAYLILRDGAAVTEDEIIAWGKEQMAGYKYPRQVTFVDSLPMTSTGKILKRELS